MRAASLHAQSVPALAPLGPERLPANVQPRSWVVELCPCPRTPPKCEPVDETAAETRQFETRFAPSARPTRPEQCMLPATVPATERFAIVALEIAENGAT